MEYTAQLEAKVETLKRERDEWLWEYIEACRSLTKRVHQGAQAVRRIAELEVKLAEKLDRDGSWNV
jgi:hypothetical protein